MAVNGHKGINVNKGRIIFLTLFCGSSILVYLIFLFNLQVIHGLEYEQRAKQVARRVLPVPAQRGEIYDRNFDIPLVTNIDSFAVSIIPAELSRDEINTLFERLSVILEIPVEKIEKEIPPNFYHLYQPIEIAGGIEFETIAYIAEHIEEFRGISWHNKSMRNYLQTRSFSHILGYVGDITTEEFQVLYNKGYDINATIGKIGIEKQYDQELRGSDGMSFSTVDVRGRRIEGVEIEDVPPENGNNLVLTVDRKIQKLCEEALGERIGSVVVLKPSSGEILAMVSYPWYDQNIFYRSDTKSELRDLSLDPRKPFVNRAIQSSYAPASTFKVLITTAVVEEEVFPLYDKITCEGSMILGNREFHCHEKMGHGSLNIREALGGSCNVFFWNMGKKLGIDLISEYAHRFGYGAVTGVDIPGEVSGLVPTPEWKERVYNSKWVGGDTLNTSIGQGYVNVTPIQMANMMAMIVNKGHTYVPHVLKEVRNPISGKIVKTSEPVILNRSTIRDETFQTVQDYLRSVITDGTAKSQITTEAVDIAGKTGTAEMGRVDSWHAWFTAYGPYETDDPDDRVIVVTMVEGANEWDWWAIRAANIIFQGIFADQSYDEAIDALNWGWYRNERTPE